MRTLVVFFLLFLPISTIAGEVGFFEITVRNQAQAQVFYAEALGWKFQDIGAKDFTLVTNAGIKGALLSTTDKIGRGSSVKLFFKSRNLSSDLAKIKKAGGAVEIEPTEEGSSWIAEFKDPDGNWIGLICENGDACNSKSH
jgi:predicted enzyme related to lactoylglutathione lyase